MSRHRPLPTAPSPDPDPAAPRQALNRRQALQGLASGLGLAIGVPAAAGHPLAAHVANRQAGSTESAETAEPAQRFLDPHQLETLALVAGIVVPGSVESGSPEYIDAVLSIETHEVQRSFVSALAAVDAAARERHGAPFKALERSQEVALLEAATAAEPRESAAPPPAQPDEPAPSASAPRTIPLENPLKVLKTWIAGAHFSSEAGMQELGFDGNMFFTAFPACPHSEGHD